jgi:NAD+--asparagine ADP-ribosyltransferase
MIMISTHESREEAIRYLSTVSKKTGKEFSYKHPLGHKQMSNDDIVRWYKKRREKKLLTNWKNKMVIWNTYGR